MTPLCGPISPAQENLMRLPTPMVRINCVFHLEFKVPLVAHCTSGFYPRRLVVRGAFSESRELP